MKKVKCGFSQLFKASLAKQNLTVLVRSKLLWSNFAGKLSEAFTLQKLLIFFGKKEAVFLCIIFLKF